VTLRFTRHGPVGKEDRRARTACAVRSLWFEPGTAAYFPSINYMRAHDWRGFLGAMRRWGSPSENQVYADTRRHIGWKPGGLTPVRPNWDGLLPVPGDGRYEWDGFLDQDRLPVALRSCQGLVRDGERAQPAQGLPLPPAQARLRVGPAVPELAHRRGAAP
jgi:penicillin amidase